MPLSIQVLTNSETKNYFPYVSFLLVSINCVVQVIDSKFSRLKHYYHFYLKRCTL